LTTSKKNLELPVTDVWDKINPEVICQKDTKEKKTKLNSTHGPVNQKQPQLKGIKTNQTDFQGKTR